MNVRSLRLLGTVSMSAAWISACGVGYGAGHDMPDPGREGDPCYGSAFDCRNGKCSSNTFGTSGNTGTTPEGTTMCYDSDGLECDLVTGRCAPMFSQSPPPPNICDWYQPTYLDPGHSVPRVPVAVASPGARTVTTGYTFSCAVISDGTVKCWGDNSKGQLGLGISYDQTPLYIPPTAVPGLGKAIAISAYDNHACAVLADGHVACWGTWLAVHGTTPTVALSPVLVAGLENVVAIDVNKFQSCAVDTAGQVWCWGILGYDGIENTGSQEPMPAAPSLIPGISDAVAVSLVETQEGYTYQGMACALFSSGQVQCWGHGHLGQAGLSRYRGDYATSSKPITVANVSDAIALAGRCALRRDGQVLCWGEVEQWNPSTGTGLISEEGMEMAGLGGAVDLAVGSAHVCVMKANGQARCQGLTYNSMGGQLGNGSDSTLGATPVDVCNIGNGVALFAGWESSCALLADGRLVCWGKNDKGQLGHGSLLQFDQPVAVVGL